MSPSRPPGEDARGALSWSGRLYRARRIGTTFGRVYLGIKTQQMVERSLAPPDMPQRWRRLHRRSARSIHGAAIELRGLILKGCQFLGSRADVLPPEYVEVLSQLQDRVPARPFEAVRRCVESELDAPLEQVFTRFSPQPVAAASLAQVHEATLRDGRRVAVKVQYPEIARLVRSDLANLRSLFRAVGMLERDLDLMPLVEELGTQVPLELDFVHEAHSSERVAAFYADRDDVHVPKVIWEHTRPRVLVMEYMEGLRISEVAALRALGIDTAALMRTLVETCCEQILVQGFFHADPHPGNLLVQPGGAPDGRARLVWLDFGLTKDLPERFREGVVTFAGALLIGDAERMGSALVDLGFETRDGRPEGLHDIAVLILETAQQLRHQSWAESRGIGEAGERLPQLIRENPIVRVPSHLVLVGRVLGLLSGLGRTLEARLDMASIVLPYALGAAARTRSAADRSPA